MFGDEDTEHWLSKAEEAKQRRSCNKDTSGEDVSSQARPNKLGQIYKTTPVVGETLPVGDPGDTPEDANFSLLAQTQDTPTPSMVSDTNTHRDKLAAVHDTTVHHFHIHHLAETT